MSSDKYTVGVDFGTLSARAVVARVSDGSIAARADYPYPHGVMSESLPKDLAGGKEIPLPKSFALACPKDYREGLFETIKRAVKESAVPAEDIIAVGIDATCSTFLPLDESGTPLCELEAFSERPHAWMKLWKHHHAQLLADELTALAHDRKEEFLSRTGGKINAEWMLPKLLEIYREDPELYSAAESFMEAGDYLVWLLTGEKTASTAALGYKLLFSDCDTSVNKEFLAAAEPSFESILSRIPQKRVPLGQAAGYLMKDAAEYLGLKSGIPVAAANIDAHVTFATTGKAEEDKMLLILGTSCCTILIDRSFHPVEGAFGILKDGIYPGYYCYESGQSAVGDMLNWFVDNAAGLNTYKEAERRGLSVHQLLTEKASLLKPGQSGLLALDWWGGNRSILADASLKGVIMGLDLNTRPEEVYRALIEGCGFGLREIIEAYSRSGIRIKELFAAGGISVKNRLFIQIYSDITGLEIRTVRSSEGSALGSAIFAASAAGKERGGYDDIFAASDAMGGLSSDVIRPNAENIRIYDRLYALYDRLHNELGRSRESVIKSLKFESDIDPLM